MPSHHQHLHRRQQWSVGEKWDDIKNDIKNIANDLTNKSPDQAQHDIEIRAPAPSTVFKTVYKTMDPTFTGEIGGYVTMNSETDGGFTAAAAPEPTSDLSLPGAQAMTTKAVGAGVLPESLVPSSGAFTDKTGLAVETATTTSRDQASNTLEPSANNIATPATSSSAASDSSSSDGGAAAKAGIAIGVLAGLLIVGLAVFFLFSRRRKQMEKERAAAEAEKNNTSFGGAAGAVGAATAGHARQPSVQTTHTTRTTATAPRLSLRPVTQFLPEFGERRSSKGAAMALALGPPPSNSQANRPGGQSPWERPMTSQSQSYDNPFGDHAEEQRAATMEQPNNPFDAPEHIVGVAQTTDAPRQAPNALSSAAAAAAGGAAAGTALTRKQSVRKDVPQPLDLTRVNEAPLPPPSLASQPSPTGTEFSFTSVAPGQSPGPSQSANAIAAAGGPAHSTVHRVQLDFKPTLEDEMELKAGQLVRLLHEYDDGWALCIRLDRSQQGVVPRTCLSTRPVKPRPAGGPPGARNGPPVNPNRGPGGPPRTPQGGRPQSPAMMGRPQSPAMSRPQSPAMRRPQSPAMRGPQSPGGPMNGRPASPGPRPMSPAGARGQSPGPRQRNTSESGPNGRRMSPPGPSPLQQQQQSRPIGRKPVPGQAY